MKTLILGGVRSGKSRMAQSLAAESMKVPILLATASAGDAEMADRIARHKAARPPHWQVIEEAVDLPNALRRHARGDRVTLIDCLTLWLTNLLEQKLDVNVARENFLNALAQAPGDVIMVSNETNSGIIPLGQLSRTFCDEAGQLHQEVAACCERVFLMVAGLPLTLK